MFGLGIPELIIILVVIMLLFGPKQLPKLGKAIGEMTSGFRKEAGSINDELDSLVIDDDGNLVERKEIEQEKATAVIEDRTADSVRDEGKPGIFCPKCGTKNQDGSSFCKSCGEKLPESGGKADDSETGGEEPSDGKLPTAEETAGEDNL